MNENRIDLENIVDQTEEICLAALDQTSFNIKFVRCKTEAIIRKAIKANPHAYSYIPDRDGNDTMIALSESAAVISLIENPAREMYIRAIMTNPIEALYYIADPDEEMLDLALSIDGLALQYFPNQTQDMCDRAVKLTPHAIRYVHKEFQTPELIHIAISADPGTVISTIKNLTQELVDHAAPYIRSSTVFRDIPYIFKTEAVCMTVVKNLPYCIRYANQFPELCMEAIKRRGIMLKYVRHHTVELIHAAIEQCPWSLEYAQYQDEEICTEAVSADGMTLQFVKNKTLEICAIAVQQNPWAIDYVPTEYLDDIGPVNKSASDLWAIKDAEDLSPKLIIEYMSQVPALAKHIPISMHIASEIYCHNKRILDFVIDDVNYWYLADRDYA